MTYQVRRASTSSFLVLRQLRHHIRQWGSAALASAERPPLVLLHGWMDVGASFQFVVDALAAGEGFERWIIAPDWRGFGLSETPQTDTYWLPDYLADLDAMLDALVPSSQFGAIDLLGHSLGGNVAMSYAGVRPQRVRRLVNLEGFGMPATQPQQAPRRLAQWLDQLKTPQLLRDYAGVDDVAQRLLKNDPLLTPDKAAWLAPHWSQPRADGRWHLLADPAHKRMYPVLFRKDEALEGFKRITAPLLWLEGDRTDTTQWWGDRYPRSDFEERLAVVAQVQRALLSPSGHMLHHDQPDAVAAQLAAFLA